MNILILGGTSFLGPHQLAYALDRGHSISTFTRGKTKPTIYQDKFDNVEQLVGDRENNLEALKNRKWDAVIANSGRKATWTKDTAELLKENADYYICVSSISVYYPYNNKTLKEGDDLVLEIPKGISENEEYLYDYGVMKANSELEAINVFGEERTAVVRPTFMMGPTDRTNRFLYYPLGLKKGGDILVPGKWNDRVQYMDVRDIAEWMIRLSESKTVGVFNGSGPASPGFISSFVYGCHAAFSSKVNYTYLDDYGFLKRNNMRFQAPWVLEEGKFNGMLGALNDKAVENGWTFRPLAKTAHDINDWWYSEAVDDKRRDEFHNNPHALHNRESEILQKWKEFKMK